MKPKKDRREHLSRRQPNLAGEHSRNLLGRWLDRGSMIADQHQALGRRILEDPAVNVPRRSTDPYDPSESARQLRGIPVVGGRGGMGGAIAGTRPGDRIRLGEPRRLTDQEALALTAMITRAKEIELLETSGFTVARTAYDERCVAVHIGAITVDEALGRVDRPEVSPLPSDGQLDAGGAEHHPPTR